nr:hypothetical protein [Tanacetum cinerariifolium]
SGTDLVSSYGTDLVWPLDGSLGTDLVGSLGTDLDGSLGTDLDGSSGTDLDGSSGTNLVGSLRTDLDGSLGTDLDSSLRTDLVWPLGLWQPQLSNKWRWMRLLFPALKDVPEVYMQEFWATTYVNQRFIRFKMNNKKHTVDLESFREMLPICHRIPGQAFAELPFEEEILEFIRFLGYGATIRTLTGININKLYQPWRSFAAIINKCLTGKSYGYDSLWLSQAQILWGLYHTRSIDYAFLIWDDFVYQVEHKNQKKSNNMYYPRFTKVIIHHFMSKDSSIPRRNKINWHYVRDDSIFSTIKVVSRHQNTQQYGAMLPIELTNDEIRNTKAYKEYYACATEEAAPKPKASARRKKSGSDTSITPPTATTTLTTTVAVTPRLTAAVKGKKLAKDKSPSDPSEVARTEAQQLKIVLRRSQQQTHISQLGGSGTDEGTDDDEGDERDESDEESDGDETREEESFDPIPRTLKTMRMMATGRGLQLSQDIEDSHVTPVNLDVQQESSSMSSQFVTSMLNPTSDAGMESIFATASSPVAPLQTSTPIMTPSTIATITTVSYAPIPPTIIPSEVLQNLPTFDSVFRFEDRLKSLEANFSEYIQTNPFAEAVSNITGIVHQYMNQQITEAVRVAIQIQTNRLYDSYQRKNDEFLRTINENMKRIIKEQVKSQHSDEQRNLYKALVDAYEADKTILDSYGDTVILKRRREDDDDQEEGPSVGSDQGSKRWREGKEPESASAPLETTTKSAGRSTTGSKSRQVSAGESAFVEEPVQTISQMDEPLYLVFEIGADDQTIVQYSQHPEWFSQPKKPPTLDRDETRPCQLVDTLTPELLAGPTFDLMKGSCTSLIELEYHLEEVYKETTDQLDWVNPEGQQYPHNLLQPLPLIPDNQGRRVIPFAHFINNDLEYLRGGASSRKYTTSVTKTKATDYGNIKWIEDLAPPSMWIQEPINYDKHALWGVSHWGRKRQQFYGFAVNRESALDVYSKRRIISVTDLKIVEWHSYKHLDWITVCHDDDKLYKFKEGDFKRLRLQDIEDMLLLLVQGKLSNLTIEERYAFNVSLRMFTRTIVIQRRMKDPQLGVESYQKRLNLTKPDTYRSDLKRREAYTTYSNPRGFIYQNKDKKNRLMRIDKLHKFSDGTLNDV